MQQFDGNGRPLSGARLFLFDGGTSTPRIGFRDSSLTSPHPNPILADSAGRLPLIYLDDGFYRHRLTTRSGTLVFDDDGLPVLSSTAGGSGTSVDPSSVFRTRDLKLRFDDQPIGGYVRLNGRSIGSAASGATERANADTQSLYEELWPFANVSVVGGKGGSAAADFAANKPLALPDARGRGLFGVDDMGSGTTTGRLTGILTSATAIGSVGGDPTVTLTQANMPSYSLTGGTVSTVSMSGATGSGSVDHTHTYSGTTGGPSEDHRHPVSIPRVDNVSLGGGGTHSVLLAPPGAGASGSANIVSDFSGNNHTHTFAGTTSGISVNHTHFFSASGTGSGVTISSGGSGAAINKLPPLMTFTIYVRL